MEPVTRDELLRRAKEDAVTVLDVRPGDGFKAGHLPVAVNIPLSELERRLAALLLAARWSPTAGGRTACCPSRRPSRCGSAASRRAAWKRITSNGARPACLSKAPPTEGFCMTPRDFLFQCFRKLGVTAETVPFSLVYGRHVADVLPCRLRQRGTAGR